MVRRGTVRSFGLMSLLLLAALSASPSFGQSSSAKKNMQNTYQATLKLPNGGLEKVEVEASNWNHAKQMLEMKYGKGNVQNVHQVR